MAASARHDRDPVPVRPGLAAETFTVTLWTDDPVVAARADGAGVDRIGPDIERLGKLERQRGRGTWISPHRIEAIGTIRAAVEHAELFARTNPLHAGSADEVERLLDAGVQILMLPMFTTPDEVERFAGIVAGRAAIVPLVETLPAAMRVDEVLAIDGVDEIHVGLNDLSLDMGLANRFAVLLSPALALVAEAVGAAGKRWACGGIGRAGDTELPIPSDLVYARLAALGAEGALLSRSFLVGTATSAQLRAELDRARERIAWWRAAPPEAHAAAAAELAVLVESAATW